MIDISPIQIIMVAVIALIVFGPKRLPEMARTAGRGFREFKDAVTMDRDGRPSGRAAANEARPEDDDDLDGLVVPGDQVPGGDARAGRPGA